MFSQIQFFSLLVVPNRINIFLLAFTAFTFFNRLLESVQSLVVFLQKILTRHIPGLFLKILTGNMSDVLLVFVEHDERRFDFDLTLLDLLFVCQLELLKIQYILQGFEFFGSFISITAIFLPDSHYRVQYLFSMRISLQLNMDISHFAQKIGELKALFLVCLFIELLQLAESF